MRQTKNRWHRNGVILVRGTEKIRSQFGFLFSFCILKIILLIMLLELSWFFPLWPPPPSTLQLPQAISPPLFTSKGHVYKFSGYSISCTVLYIPWLLCNDLFVLLNPLTSSLISLHLPPIWQPSKCSPYHWLCLCSCLLSLFFRFSCWYVFFAILLFIVLIFFFLNNSL